MGNPQHSPLDAPPPYEESSSTQSHSQSQSIQSRLFTPSPPFSSGSASTTRPLTTPSVSTAQSTTGYKPPAAMNPLSPGQCNQQPQPKIGWEMSPEQIQALEKDPGCCFSTRGGCCFSDMGGCCFSSNGACCFSDHGGCCFSDHGGCCCGDHGGACCSSPPPRGRG